MRRRVGIEIVGNAASAVKAMAGVGSAAQTMGREIQDVGIKAEASAKKQIDAAVKTRAAIRENILAYQQMSIAAARGSDTQIAASNLLAREKRRLAGNLAVSGGEAAALTGAGVRGGVMSKLNSGVSSVTGMSLKGSGALTAGFVAFEAIKSAASFQRTMNIFGAVSGATARQMSAASKEAIILGNDMTLPATSAADAAKAMTELSKAGISVSDTLGAAKGVLQLSAAAQMDNADAAAIVARNLNAFSLRGAEASHIADLLAATANATSGEMTDVADALSYVASSAAQAHIPIEDTVAALGEMANKGIIGGMAGAALQQMLLKLESPTAKASKEMKKLGINIYDSHGAMLGMPAIIQQFTQKTAGMSDAQRNAAMNAMFGARAIRAANIVLLGGVDAFNKMRRATDQQGAAARLAAARNKGLAGAWDGLRSSAETLGIELGSQLTGPLEKVTRLFAGLLGNSKLQIAAFKTMGLVVSGLKAPFDGLEVAGKAAGNIGSAVGHKLFGGGGGEKKVTRAEISAAGKMLTAGASPNEIGTMLYKQFGVRDIGTAKEILGAASYTRSFSPDNRGFVAGVGKAGTAAPGDGGSGGVGAPPKFKQLILPFSIRQQEASAMNPAQDLAVARAELGYVNRMISSGRLAPKALLDALKMRRQLTDEIAASEKKDEQFSIPMKLQLEAAMSLTQAGDVKAAKDELAYVNKAIASGKLKGDALVTAYQQRRQLMDTIKSSQQKIGDFLVPKKIQLGEARADALAAMDPSHQGPTAAQFALAKQVKSAAMKAIHSHKLSFQGLIDAWNAVGQANQTLAQKASMTDTTKTYKLVSMNALTAGLNLAGSSKKLLQERISQAQAHGGARPTGPAAQGQIVHIDTVHVHGVQNVDELYGKLGKVARKRRVTR